MVYGKYFYVLIWPLCFREYSIVKTSKMSGQKRRIDVESGSSKKMRDDESNLRPGLKMNPHSGLPFSPR